MEEKFTISEFKNFLMFNGGTDLIHTLTVEKVKQANKGVKKTSGPIRNERFGSSDEMGCPNCKMSTLHVLRLNKSAKKPEELWTCTTCGNQRN